MNRRIDYLISIILLLFGSFVFLMSNTIPTMVAVEQSSVINSRFFPKLMSLFLVLLSIWTLAETYINYRRSKNRNVPSEKGDVHIRQKSWLRLIESVILIGIYFLVFNRLGFLISSVLFMLCFLLMLGTRRWYVFLSLSITVPLAIWLIFRVLFSIYLPEGLFAF